MLSLIYLLLAAPTMSQPNIKTHEVEVYELISQNDTQFGAPNQRNNMNPLPSRPRRHLPTNTPALLSQKKQPLESHTDEEMSAGDLHLNKSDPNILTYSSQYVKKMQ